METETRWHNTGLVGFDWKRAAQIPSGADGCNLGLGGAKERNEQEEEQGTLGSGTGNSKMTLTKTKERFLKQLTEQLSGVLRLWACLWWSKSS